MYKKITTLEKALKKAGITIFPDLSALPAKYSRGMIALLKLQIIIEAVNNDDPKVAEWKADFNDSNQQKWYPWYVGGSSDGSGSGFRFNGTYCGWTFTIAFGGARLVLKDEKRAEHMNKYFSDLYKDLLLILV